MQFKSDNGLAFVQAFQNAWGLRLRERQMEHNMALEKARDERAQKLFELQRKDHELSIEVKRANVEQHKQAIEKAAKRHSLEARLFAEEFLTPEGVADSTKQAVGKLMDGEPVDVTFATGNVAANDASRENSGGTQRVLAVHNPDDGNVYAFSLKESGDVAPYTVNPKDNGSQPINLGPVKYFSQLYAQNMSAMAEIAKNPDPLARSAMYEAQAKANANIVVDSSTGSPIPRGRSARGERIRAARIASEPTEQPDVAPLSSGRSGRGQKLRAERLNPNVAEKAPAKAPVLDAEAAAKQAELSNWATEVSTSSILKDPSKIEAVKPIESVAGAEPSSKAKETIESLKATGSVPVGKMTNRFKPSPSLIKELKEGIEKGYMTSTEARNVLETGRMDTSLADLQKAGFGTRKAQIDYQKSVVELQKALADYQGKKLDNQKKADELANSGPKWDAKTTQAAINYAETIAEKVALSSFGYSKDAKSKAGVKASAFSVQLPELIQTVGLAPDTFNNLSSTNFIASMYRANEALSNEDFAPKSLYPAYVAALAGMDWTDEESMQVLKVLDSSIDMKALATKLTERRQTIDRMPDGPEKQQAMANLKATLVAAKSRAMAGAVY